MSMAVESSRLPADPPETVKVWDPFVRLFHWLLAGSFAGAFILAEDGGAVHEAMGYIALSLVIARIVWGFIGTKYARFAEFVPSPGQLFGYLRDVVARREPRYIGHNPAGAMMILALLGAVLATGLTGWLMTTDALFGVEWIEELHEGLATATLLLASVHVAGALYASVRHGENLVLAMITGRKQR